jgi:hypothetical protein
MINIDEPVKGLKIAIAVSRGPWRSAWGKQSNLKLTRNQMLRNDNGKIAMSLNSPQSG